ncbi:hypothetical protein ACMFMG_008013 [Clarireedia jacksonii]
MSVLERLSAMEKMSVPSPGTRMRGKKMPAPECDSSDDSSSSDESRIILKSGPGGNIVFVPAAEVKKTKHMSPQDAIDEFWTKFKSKTPGKASTVLPKNFYTQKASEKANNKVKKGQNAVASYEEAAAICRAKVEKIVKECRRVNQKYRDPHFDIEFDLKWGKGDCLRMLQNTSDKTSSTFQPGSVKRVGDIFDNPQFYVQGASANDIRQGRDGDCWFMAALCTLGNKPGLIEKVCVARDEQIGVYGFVFHRDGEWRSEIIDDKLYLTKPDYDESWIERNLIEDRQRINSEEDYRKIYQSNSGALYFAQCEDPNETWLPLLEKAYAKAHGDYAAIEGGFTGEGLEDLTGGVTTEIFSTDILDKEYFWKEELLKVNKDFLFGCAAGIFWGRGYRKGIYEGHAYSILRAVEIDGQRLVLLRNPWGEGEWKGAWSDGSKEWTPEWMQKLDHRFGDDGSFWMSYEDLLKKYQTFDRTRLFTDEWKVTQQWTSLEVPWTVNYHDTKFSFTLDKPAPVMIVLSQLDSRYFCGLEGQYKFELSFRVHKAGEEDYIVRSHGNYWMRRSVTAELELPAGEYDILMKVKAFKEGHNLPVEDVIRNNAKKRRDKLSRIGLSYDLAHAKGVVKETAEEKKARKEAEEKKKAKERKEVKEKLMKDKKKRIHNENKEKRKMQVKKLERIAKAKTKKAKKEAKAKAEAELAAAKKALEDSKKAEEEAAKKKEQEAREKSTQTEDFKVVEVQVSAEPAQSEVSGSKKDGSPAPTTETTPSAPGAPTSTSSTAKSAPKSSDSTNTKDKDAKTKDTVIEIKSITIETQTPPPAPAPAPAQITSPNAPTPTVPNPPPRTPIEAEDDSDLESIVTDVSDITVGVIDDYIEAVKNVPPPPPPAKGEEEEEDEFEKDPWNAVVVVGLRVYSKESAVTVAVKRGKKWEDCCKGKKKKKGKNGEVDSESDADGDDEDGDDEKESAMEVGEKKLDVDDSAADAADAAVVPEVASPDDEEKGKELGEGMAVEEVKKDDKKEEVNKDDKEEEGKKYEDDATQTQEADDRKEEVLSQKGELDSEAGSSVVIV